MPELRVIGRTSVRRAKAAQAKLDLDLSRALDAIEFLAKNEIGPAPLLARISPEEAELVAKNLEKAVDWLTRFADGWHVYIGNVKVKGAVARAGPSNGRLKICAASGSD